MVADKNGAEQKKKEQVLIEKTKKLSVKEACAYSFMDGFGLRYVTPYALSVGANNNQIGLLSSVPGLLGSLVQLFTIKAMAVWTRKKIIFSSVLFQAIMWLFLILAGIPFFLFGIKTSLSPNLVIIIYTLLIIVGAFGGPAWTSMMRDLVLTKRGDYFGKRNRIAGIIGLGCLFVAGFILDYFKQTHIFIGFIILFVIAFFGRFTSAMLMRKHYDPQFKPNDKKYFTIIDFIKKMRYNNFGRFAMYFSFVSFAVAIASPFFVVFYFKNLGFSYTQYMITIVANSLATIILMPLWGKFADKYGNLKVMKITGALIPLLPFLYMLISLFSSKIVIIFLVILIEIYSGVIWAGFNLAAGNFIYDAVSRERLTICSSYFNILNGFSALVGALIGGYLASQNFGIWGLSSLLFVFLIGGIARLVAHFTMIKKIKEVRVVDGFSVGNHLKDRATKIYFESKKLVKSALRSTSLDRFFEAMVSESEHHYSSNPNNFVKNN